MQTLKTNRIIDHGVLSLLLSAARAKRILNGRGPALLDRLQGFASDLPLQPLPVPFTGEDSPLQPPSAWDIGGAFSRSVFRDGILRKQAGGFYTPETVVDQVLDMAWDKAFPDNRPSRKVTFLDPAMGCGFFLVRTAERLLRSNPAGSVRRWAQRNLCGVDISPEAVFMTRALLWLILSNTGAEFVPDPERLRQGDALLGPAFGESAKEKRTAAAEATEDALDWSRAFPDIAAQGGFSLIAGNPPYEVLTNFQDHPARSVLARALRASGFYPDSSAGQCNLYRYFCERALALLRPDGLLTFVVPMSLARDKAALHLRRRLLEREGAAEWLLFGEDAKLFPGVTQSACIFLARKNAGKIKKLAVSAGGQATSASGGRVELDLSEIDFNSAGGLIIPCLTEQEAALWRWLRENCPAGLADAAEIRVGEVDQTFFRDCMADTDTGCVLARGGHLSPFRLDVNPTEGKERFLRLNLFLEKKGTGAEQARNRAGLWRVAQLGIRNMRTRPRLVASLAPPGVYLGNSLNYYIPKAGTSLAFLAGLLNSRLLDWLFCLASGNNNINLHEMKRLPYPAGAGANQIKEVEEAYAVCANAAENGADLAEARTRLDAAVEACYGVPAESRTCSLKSL